MRLSRVFSRPNKPSCNPLQSTHATAPHQPSKQPPSACDSSAATAAPAEIAAVVQSSPVSSDVKHHQPQTSAPEHSSPPAMQCESSPAKPGSDPQSLMRKRLVQIDGSTLYAAQVPFIVSARYCSLKYLGEGSYGIVVSAVDRESNNRPVAIKRVHQAFSTIDDARHLLREVRLLRALDHPNVMPLLDVDLPNSYPAWDDVCLVSPLLPSSLSRSLSRHGAQARAAAGTNSAPRRPVRSTLPDDVIRRVLAGLLRGLKYMHSGNVVHRDIKPGNILLDKDWNPVICDLGLARPIENDTELTENVVTKPYRAPELFLTPDVYDSAVDMWSVGCCLHELLAPGARPLFAKHRGQRFQLETIFAVIGTPSDEELHRSFDAAGRWYVSKLMLGRRRPALSLEQRYKGAVDVTALNPDAVDLMQRLLALDPRGRPTAAEALEHPFLAPLREPELQVSMSAEESASVAKQEPMPSSPTGFTVKELRRLMWDEAAAFHPEQAKLLMESGHGPGRADTATASPSSSPGFRWGSWSSGKKVGRS